MPPWALLALALALPVGSQAQEEPLAPVNAEENIYLRRFGACGLVTRYSSSQLAEACLTQAENVYLDEDAGVSRRKGFSKYNATALPGTLKSVRGEWYFRGTDGTEYIIILSSQSMYQSSGNGAFTLIPGLASLSATQDMDCTQCLGRFWCVNGSDTMFYWDGTSTATVPGAPTCQANECFRNRVVLANCSGTLSQLRLSGELDGTDYTISASPVSTSPAVISIGGVNDGKRLTGIIGVYQDVLLTGKIDSIYGLYGFDRRDFAVREISREVGLLENRSSMEKQGSLYWISQRGIEKMRGTTIDRVSDPIRDLVDTIILSAGNSRSITDTSQADFEAGNLTASGAGAPMSATISPGSIVPSTFSIADTVAADFDLGTYAGTGSNPNQLLFGAVGNTYPIAYDAAALPEASDPAWTRTESSCAGCAEASVSASTLTASVGSGTGAYEIFTKLLSPSTTIHHLIVARFKTTGSSVEEGTSIGFYDSTTQPRNASTAFKVRVYLLPSTINYQPSVASTESIASNSFSTYTVLVTSYSVARFWRNGVFKASGTYTGTWDSIIIHTGNGATNGSVTGDIDSVYYASSVADPGNNNIPTASTSTSRIFNTGVSTPVAGVFTVTLNTPSGTTAALSIRRSTSPNNDLWSAYESVTPGNKPTTINQQYVQYRATFSHLNFQYAPAISDVSLLFTTTGYFVSQCLNSGTAITSWGLMQCNQDLNDGSLSLQMSTGATCAAATAADVTWNTQVNNSVISAPTAAFTAYRRLFGVDSATQTPKHRDCTINWNEGTSRPSVSAEVYRDRYYLAYTSGTTGTPVNDNILVLDSNDQWVVHTAPNCASLLIYNRNLYCGDSGDSGQVYQMDVGQDDDGATFTSTIKTKDFDFGNPFQRKVLSRIYYDLSGLPAQDYSIDLTPSYALDASTDSVTLSNIGLDEDYSRFIAAKVPADLSNNVTGRWFSFSLSHTGIQGPWKLFGLKVVFKRLKED